jgi:dTDP-4-dehydrorhamnose 3,5-epimerase
MSKFIKIKTSIDGLIVIKPKVYDDNSFLSTETYMKKDFIKLGIIDEFIQDNFSKSKKGILRGLHFQLKFIQGKLINVTKGRGISVAVDLRYQSKTFAKWFKIELTSENKKMFYLPKGFAHGFLALEDDTEIQYKCTDYYSSEYDSGILWNDKDIGIDWEFEKYGLNENEIILSEKDKIQQTLKEFIEKGIRL